MAQATDVLAALNGTQGFASLLGLAAGSCDRDAPAEHSLGQLAIEHGIPRGRKRSHTHAGTRARTTSDYI